jgi:hypothetical protein
MADIIQYDLNEELRLSEKNLLLRRYLKQITKARLNINWPRNFQMTIRIKSFQNLQSNF